MTFSSNFISMIGHVVEFFFNNNFICPWSFFNICFSSNTSLLTTFFFPLIVGSPNLQSLINPFFKPKEYIPFLFWIEFFFHLYMKISATIKYFNRWKVNWFTWHFFWNIENNCKTWQLSNYMISYVDSFSP